MGSSDRDSLRRRLRSHRAAADGHGFRQGPGGDGEAVFGALVSNRIGCSYTVATCCAV